MTLTRRTSVQEPPRRASRFEWSEADQQYRPIGAPPKASASNTATQETPAAPKATAAKLPEDTKALLEAYGKGDKAEQRRIRQELRKRGTSIRELK